MLNLSAAPPRRTSSPRPLAAAFTFLIALSMIAADASAGEPEAVDAQNTASASREGARSASATRARSGKKVTRKRTRRTTTTRRAARRDGPYVTGGLGLVTISDQPSNLDLNDGTGINAGVGFRLTPELALEGNFIGTSHDVGNASNADGSMTGASLNLKYFFPLSDSRMEAFAEGGLGLLGVTNGEDEIDGTFFGIGGGLGYRLSREVSLGAKANFMSISGEDSNSDTADLGAFTLMGTISFEL